MESVATDKDQSLLSEPPNSVVYPIYVFVILLGVGLLSDLWNITEFSFFGFYKNAIIYALWAFFLYNIYFGKKWARNCLTVFLLLIDPLVIYGVFLTFNEAPGAALWAIVGVCAECVAIGMLYLPESSSRWFSQKLSRRN